MTKKAEYQPPRVQSLSFTTEEVLETNFSQIELPDHDWAKQKPVTVFPEDV